MGKDQQSNGGEVAPDQGSEGEGSGSGEQGRSPADQAEQDADESTAGSDQACLTEEQLEEALREKSQFRAMAQRAQADLVNFKRRASEERAEGLRHAKTQLILKMLPIVDDLEMAIAMVPDDAVASGWLEGLRLVQRKIESFLGSEGVTKIDALGKPFEPSEHEAVLYEPSPDGIEEGTVVRVIRDGYKRDGLAIRAAQVAVSKAAEEEDQTNATDEEA